MKADEERGSISIAASRYTKMRGAAAALSGTCDWVEQSAVGS